VARCLVGVPRHGRLELGIADSQAGIELADLLVRQVLSTASEQAADLVQRVVLVPVPAEGVLLDAVADLVDPFVPSLTT
jgi:hypothetical protein